MKNLNIYIKVVLLRWRCGNYLERTGHSGNVRGLYLFYTNGKNRRFGGRLVYFFWYEM
jgi:hypothetical protein